MKHYDQSSTRKHPPISYIKKIIWKGGEKTSKIHMNIWIRTCTQKCNLQVNRIGKVQWTCIAPDVYEWFFWHAWWKHVDTMHIRVHSPLTALFWLLRQEKESQSRAELTAKFVDLMIHKHKKNNHPPPQ